MSHDRWASAQAATRRLDRRLISLGVRPWRMGSADYRHAVAATGRGDQLELAGAVSATSWDPELAAPMNAAGVAVHEEELLEQLLTDLRTIGHKRNARPAPGQVPTVAS